MELALARKSISASKWLRNGSVLIFSVLRGQRNVKLSLGHRKRGLWECGGGVDEMNEIGYKELNLFQYESFAVFKFMRVV
jgi:hypothetical protein